MTKLEFIFELKDKLSKLPKKELQERLNFYSEMIEDRMEEGLSEEAAVAAVGATNEIAAQIIAETPKQKAKTKFKIEKIMLLGLGFPVWFPLLVAAFGVIFAIYISLWAVFAAFVGCAVGGVISAVIFAVNGNTPTGIAMLGAALICAGLAIFIFFGCKLITKGMLVLTKKIFLLKRGK